MAKRPTSPFPARLRTRLVELGLTRGVVAVHIAGFSFAEANSPRGQKDETMHTHEWTQHPFARHLRRCGCGLTHFTRYWIAARRLSGEATFEGELRRRGQTRTNLDSRQNGQAARYNNWTNETFRMITGDQPVNQYSPDAAKIAALRNKYAKSA